MYDIIKKALLQKVERLEAFEERLNVRLENISIVVNNQSYFDIFCEIHPISGTAVNGTIFIYCVIYDKEGSILENTYLTINEESFFGFEVLHFIIFDNVVIEDIGKIRIYPKR